MVDVLLFIPRLIWDVLKDIWAIIVFVFEFLVQCVHSFFPVEDGNWPVLIGVAVWLILSIALRKEFGGIVKAMLTLFVALVVGVLMWALNPIGLVITLVVACLVGFGVLEGRSWVYMVLGLMWAGMIVYSVMC